QEDVLRHAGEAGPPAAVADARRPGRGRPPSATTPASPSRGPDLIPIRSAARGGTDQAMFLEDGPIGYTPRPANLGGVRAAYAIYMVGDSMEPRYEPGWLLHVNPFKPPVRGRDVVVYKHGQAVLIKTFIGWEGDTLVLRQLNPPDTLRIPRDEVNECHLVVGADQEGGGRRRAGIKRSRLIGFFGRLRRLRHTASSLSWACDFAVNSAPPWWRIRGGIAFLLHMARGEAERCWRTRPKLRSPM